MNTDNIVNGVDITSVNDLRNFILVIMDGCWNSGDSTTFNDKQLAVRDVIASSWK